jgi:Tol biopolymer transport system component
LTEQIHAYFDDADRQQGAVDSGALRRGVEEDELIMVEVSELDGLPPEAPIRGRRWPIIAAAAVVLVAVAALVLSYRRDTRDSQPAAPPPLANGLIAFVGGTDDNTSTSDIYLVAPNGTGLRPLTSTPGFVEYAPAWSPDGSRLAFLRTADDEFSDDVTAASPCETVCRLVVVDPSTGVETFSVDIGEVTGVVQSLAWSPDGDAIAISSASCDGVGNCGPSTSVLAEIETGSFTTFTPAWAYEAMWSPDDEWLALFLASDRGGSLLLVPADLIPAGGVVDVADVADLPGVRALPERSGDVFLRSVEWMPDGSAMLGTFGEIDVSIDVVTVADGERRTLIEDGFDPVMSPDGSQIAYFREDRPGPKEVWVAAADGSDPRRVTVSSTTPAWSPDGRLLLAEDHQGWFTVRPDGTDRTTLGIRDQTPSFRFEGFIASGIDWQPLPPGSSTPTEQPATDVAMGFVGAYGAHDADQAITYLADDTHLAITYNSHTSRIEGTPEQLRLHLAWLEAVRDQRTLDSCDRVSSSADGTAIRCTYEFHSFGSDELGRGPFRGSYFDLTVRDGKIVQATETIEISEFSPQMWEPFADWMDANYPADADVMYSDATRTEPRRTDESIQLWEQHIREYVDAHAGAEG